MTLLEDRVAIVSGVGPGIGHDTAVALAREGANVVLGARTEERLRQAAGDVEALGRKALWSATDVTDESACAALAATALEAFGRIDVLVNNAYVQPPFESVEKSDVDSWRSTYDVNVLGSLHMTRAVLPAMRRQKRGSIVFVNSMSARRHQPGLGPYSASKAALLSLVVTLAQEAGPDGIRVNSVVPGYVWGPSLKWWFKQLAKDRAVDRRVVYDEIASETALRRLPEPAEIADAILFLASDLARGITGQAVDVNGGHWFA
jgi:NAD(P)-dependent dehydrogenase (short-subunit alcohol dehydrogenase family)